MATFLELSKKLRQYAGLSGTGPAAVTGQSGMDLKLVDWINSAWYEIQSLHPTWRWMWKNDGLITCVPGQRTYDFGALGFSVNFPDRESLRRRVAGDPGTEMWLQWYEYPQFRETFLFGPTRSGIPLAATVDPSGILQLDPVPNAAYEVRFDYHKSPTLLVNSSDEPDLPAKFHDIILYRALMMYAAHDGAPDVFNDAKANYEMWERRLESEQLVAPVQGVTLA